ncbi:MAG: hypothetical protein BMS9Abin37_0553 [Acidobacteriota bacterium]|nr:MAG: hypothetical protein BMS9Abin37_0553 [Acidobacteriota bacterium]
MLNHLNGGRADSSYEKRLLTYLRPDSDTSAATTKK